LLLTKARIPAFLRVFQVVGATGGSPWQSHSAGSSGIPEASVGAYCKPEKQVERATNYILRLLS